MFIKLLMFFKIFVASKFLQNMQLKIVNINRYGYDENFRVT